MRRDAATGAAPDSPTSGRIRAGDYGHVMASLSFLAEEKKSRSSP